MATLDDVVRHRYETGAYGNAHIRMTALDWQNARATMPAPAPAPVWSPSYDPMASLLSIPVVIDESVPAGAWRLVENGTEEVITEGTFDA